MHVACTNRFAVQPDFARYWLHQANDGVSRLTNAAYGGAGRKTLYICDSYGGRILTAELPVAGVQLFSHL